MSNSKNVVIYLELGHKATVKTHKTNEGFTHDWEVFVRGSGNAQIESFVEKVVFYLHSSFDKPKRVLHNPPYKVCEKGYGGFNLTIEIHIKSNDEHRKSKVFKFDYDLFLQSLDSAAITHNRSEKLLFFKPNEEFRRKLLQGGGVEVSSAEDSRMSEKCSKSRPSNGAKTKPTARHQSTPSTTFTNHIAAPENTKKKDVKKESSRPPKESDQFKELFGEIIRKGSSQKSEKKPPIKDKITKDKPKESIKSPSTEKESGKKRTEREDKEKDSRARDRERNSKEDKRTQEKKTKEGGWEDKKGSGEAKDRRKEGRKEGKRESAPPGGESSSKKRKKHEGEEEVSRGTRKEERGRTESKKDRTHEKKDKRRDTEKPKAAPPPTAQLPPPSPSPPPPPVVKEDKKRSPPPTKPLLPPPPAQAPRGRPRKDVKRGPPSPSPTARPPPAPPAKPTPKSSPPNPPPSRSSSRSRSPPCSISSSSPSSRSSSPGETPPPPQSPNSLSPSPSRSRSRSSSRSGSSLSSSKSKSSSPKSVSRSASESRSRSKSKSGSSISSCGSSPSRGSPATVGADGGDKGDMTPLKILALQVGECSTDSEGKLRGPPQKGPSKGVRSPSSSSPKPPVVRGEGAKGRPPTPLTSEESASEAESCRRGRGSKRRRIRRDVPGPEDNGTASWSGKNREDSDTSPSQPVSNGTPGPQQKTPSRPDLLGGSPTTLRLDFSSDYLRELSDLRTKIVRSFSDRAKVQEIVNIVGCSASFQLSHANFTFDLCALDRPTIRKLQHCLS